MDTIYPVVRIHLDNMYPENERSRMAMSKSKRKIHFDISFWVAVSAVAVLGVILMIVAAAHFQWQRDKAVALFVEKGATLINSFEAGFRNTADKKNRLFYLQKLLTATAQQPDIDPKILAPQPAFDRDLPQARRAEQQLVLGRLDQSARLR